MPGRIGRRVDGHGLVVRAGLLDSLFGTGSEKGEDGKKQKKVGKIKRGTKTVAFCGTCKNKGQEKCPGCNGTCQVRRAPCQPVLVLPPSPQSWRFTCILGCAAAADVPVRPPPTSGHRAR